MSRTIIMTLKDIVHVWSNDPGERMCRANRVYCIRGHITLLSRALISILWSSLACGRFVLSKSEGSFRKSNNQIERQVAPNWKSLIKFNNFHDLLLNIEKEIWKAGYVSKQSSRLSLT